MGNARPLFRALSLLLVAFGHVLGSSCPSSQGNISGLPVDPDTPLAACTLAVPGQSSGSPYVLVMSDEFESPGRGFSAAANDSRWTAENQYYAATQDHEVYKPSAVTTANGSLVITTSQGEQWAYTQLEDGTAVNVPQNISSGMVTGWNKQCITGGYVEIRARLPGDTMVSGLWAAMWMMGNLGRPGYLDSTVGKWPYSYSNASDCPPASQPWSTLAPQAISACPDHPPATTRAKWGLLPGQGRGVPEMDIAEVIIPGGNTATSKKPPRITQSLQMAPLLPPGLNWVDPAFYSERGLPMGYSLPGATVPPFDTTITQWWGDLTPANSSYPRPGSQLSDVYSSQSSLNDSYYEGMHTYGVLWEPGQMIRFYIDGVATFEVNKTALVGACNAAGQCVAERLIPEEPMYIILNTALSDTFTPVSANLPLPAHFLIDYVRVYQSQDAVNVGCNPASHPTARYIACNRDQYLIKQNYEDALIPDSCDDALAPAAAPAGNPASSGGSIGSTGSSASSSGNTTQGVTTADSTTNSAGGRRLVVATALGAALLALVLH